MIFRITLSSYHSGSFSHMLLGITPPIWFPGDLKDPEVFGPLNLEAFSQGASEAEVETKPVHATDLAAVLPSASFSVQDKSSSESWPVFLALAPCSLGLLFLNSSIRI